MFIALPLLVMEPFDLVHERNALRRARLAEIESLADLKVRRIEDFFLERKGDIAQASEYAPVRDSLPALNRMEISLRNPQYLAIRRSLDQRLLSLQHAYGYEDVLLVGLNGKVVYCTNPRHFEHHLNQPLPDPGDRAFLAGKNGIFVSEIFQNPLLPGGFFMMLTAPVRDQQEQLAGVIAFGIKMDSVYGLIMDTTGLGKTGETFIVKNVSDSALFISPPTHHPDLVFKKAVREGEPVGLPAQALLRRQSGSGESMDYLGHKVLAAWRYIPDRDWGLVVKMDASEAYAEIYRSIRWHLMFLGLILIAGALAAFILARSVSKPILALQEGAEIIGRGNLDHKVGTDSQDEVGRLSRAFDQMTESLKKVTASRDDLEKEIAERRRVEEALRQNESRLQEAQRLAQFGNWELDLVRNHLAWSDEIYHIFEMDPAHFRASYEAFLETIHPDDRDRVNEAYQNSVRNRAPYEMVHRLKMKDGRVKFVQERGETFYDANGAPLRSIGTVQDITERKRAEEALRAAGQYARSLLEASLDPLVMISAEGKITDVNEATEEATGISREKLIGSDFSDYFTEPEKAREGYRKVFSSGEVRDYPLAIRHISGKITEVLYNAAVYRDSVGKVQGVFAAARDITERKRTLEQLRQSEGKLLETLEDLKRSNKELEQFAYVASHDLQEPLRMVASFTQLLERRYGDKLDSDAREFIKFAVDGAMRMQRLINDLLSYSRVGTRGQPLDPTDAHAALGEAIANLGSAIEESHALVTNDDLPMVKADQSQLVQVFQNLIGNALKFRGEQSPRVQVSAQKDGKFWRFSVSDNGIGIDPQYQERIFVIFQRLNASKDYPGTGIGLALCKRILERHGGRIWVESALGNGSTFYFTIPG